MTEQEKKIILNFIEIFEPNVKKDGDVLIFTATKNIYDWFIFVRKNGFINLDDVHEVIPNHKRYRTIEYTKMTLYATNNFDSVELYYCDLVDVLK